VNIQGWGYEVRRYFGPGLAWRNDAWGGESTTSFIAEGRWGNAIAAHPRFILIMFGTDDCCEAGQYADANTTYRDNLRRMVIDARAVGAQPILIQSPPIRTPGYDGFGVLTPGFVEPWANAAADVGAEMGVPVVVLYDRMLDIYNDMGQVQAQALFGLDNPPGSQDLIHFSPYGADWVAQRIVGQIPTVAPDLAAYLAAAQPVSALPLPARAALIGALGLLLIFGARTQLRQ
jgi:lysophospholipase L1-like esterase